MSSMGGARQDLLRDRADRRVVVRHRQNLSRHGALQAPMRHIAASHGHGCRAGHFHARGSAGAGLAHDPTPERQHKPSHEGENQNDGEAPREQFSVRVRGWRVLVVPVIVVMVGHPTILARDLGKFPEQDSPVQGSDFPLEGPTACAKNGNAPPITYPDVAIPAGGMRLLGQGSLFRFLSFVGRLVLGQRCALFRRRCPAPFQMSVIAQAICGHVLSTNLAGLQAPTDLAGHRVLSFRQWGNLVARSTTTVIPPPTSQAQRQKRGYP
jgi:hypothetical protein